MAITLDELIAIVESLAAAPGERAGLTELDHALQCAYELSLAVPEDVELQVAGLVHDIGHQWASDADHGTAAAVRIRDLLGARVAGAVAGHVPAKRYLVTVDDAYTGGLSEGSTASLAVQGGTMTEQEVAGFRATGGWEDAVALRRADDAAKVPGREVPGLEAWIPMLHVVAS